MTVAGDERSWQTFGVDEADDRGVVTVVLHGTGGGNAMGGLVWQELPALMAALAADRTNRVVVLRGAADCFSVGLDLRWYVPHYRRTVRPGDGLPAVRSQLLADALAMQAAITAVAESPLPVVAAVHGPCIGAGLDLVCACDIRLAAADAVFSLREVRLGVVADLGSLQRLPRIIGAGHTRELALTGRDMPAHEARAMGLVTRVLAAPTELFDAARETAREIAGHPAHTLAGIKQVLDASLDQPLAAGLRQVALWNAAFLPSPELPGLLTDALRAPAQSRRACEPPSQPSRRACEPPSQPSRRACEPVTSE